MEKALVDLKGNQKEQAQAKKDIPTSSQAYQDEKNIDEKNMLKFLESKMKEMETEFDIEENIVIDLGSAYTKIGFSGEDLPRLVVPSILSNLKSTSDEKAIEKNQHLYGYEIFKETERQLFDTKFLNPGDHVEVIDKEFLEFLKEMLENRLNIQTSEFNVIVNHSPIKNKDNIIALSKMFLDDMNFKGLALLNSSSLSLFSTGKTTGVVVECGETKTSTVPIYEGFPLFHALNKNHVGGRDVTQVLHDGMQANKDIGFTMDDLIFIREIKDRMCYMPYLKPKEHYLNSNEDVLPEEKRLYKMPDKKIVEIPKSARIMASEVLFDPKICNKEEKGLKEILSDSLMKTVIDNDELKKIMCSNIMLAGGTSMMPGLAKRIKSELTDFREDLIVTGDSQRYISAWIGGSMISSMSTFNQILVTRGMYMDSGEDRIAIFKRVL